MGALRQLFPRLTPFRSCAYVSVRLGCYGAPTGGYMQIWVVTQYYPPENGAPSARWSGFASEWVRHGQEVVVLTGIPNHPDGVIHPQYRDKLGFFEETLDGVRVRRHWLYVAPNRGVLPRVANMLSFAASIGAANLLSPRGPRPDVIVASSPSFFAVASAFLLAKRYDAAFVFEVRDLWPAIFLQMEILKPGPLYDALERLELALYRGADAVVTVTQSFAEEIHGRGIPADKLWVVYNGVSEADMAHAAAATTSEEPGALRARLGIAGDKPVVLYLGNHGAAQGLDQLIDAARSVGPQVEFLLVGQGADKERLMRAAADLSNVRFLSQVPHAETWAWYAMADLNVVCLKDLPDFHMFIPSKMFEIMAAAAASVGALRGEGAARMLASGSASVVDSGDAAGLAKAITVLLADPANRRAMGDAGRAFVEAEHRHGALAARYLNLLRHLRGEAAGELPPAGVP